VIVTGDFNAGEQNPAIRFLLGEIDKPYAEGGSVPSPNLVDTFREVWPDTKDVGTFNSFRGARTGEKIDAVFVSREWDVTVAAIVRTESDGRYPSDHFPVVATISLGGDTTGGN
jgi:endonuclease/exonuclease/phosphatase family metal-dependent hydrolase